MPLSLQAGFWGLLAGSALVLGAAIAWFVPVPRRVIAAVMAFGSGVISALSFELMDEAFRRGGFDPTSIGFSAARLCTPRPMSALHSRCPASQALRRSAALG
jgi:ZIP family zinc transporter